MQDRTKTIFDVPCFYYCNKYVINFVVILFDAHLAPHGCTLPYERLEMFVYSNCSNIYEHVCVNCTQSCKDNSVRKYWVEEPMDTESPL